MRIINVESNFNSQVEKIHARNAIEIISWAQLKINCLESGCAGVIDWEVLESRSRRESRWSIEVMILVVSSAVCVRSDGRLCPLGPWSSLPSICASLQPLKKPSSCYSGPWRRRFGQPVFQLISSRTSTTITQTATKGFGFLCSDKTTATSDNIIQLLSTLYWTSRK